ncbi:MAG: NUDIX domain-containing protein [Candidatus Micrarchaeota archaeon]|nr:NUDIX domain-containing protein [Candidatus Micrarchaeota archaeon]
MADAEEPLEIFNDNFESIGVAPRSEAHRKGLWHKTFHCWIAGREGDKRYLVLQLRGPEKEWFPNMLDITAGGHILAGETDEESTRELDEEMGVKAKLSDLVPLGVRVEPTISGNLINREFCMVYLLELSKPIEDYDFQVEEVSGVFKVYLNDGIALLTGKASDIRADGVIVENGERKRVTKTFTTGDFIKTADNYYLKMFILADRYFNGEDRGRLLV